MEYEAEIREIEVLHDSKEYIWVAISATKAGVTYDPTARAVDFTFCDEKDYDHPNLDDATWHPGSWETVAGVHRAQCLLNEAAGFAPSAHTGYGIIVRVTDNPESPKLRGGILRAL